MYFSNAADRGKRIFFGGTDNNDNPLYTLDNSAQVNGFFLTMLNPYVKSTYILNSLSHIHKEITYGPISIYDVDQTTLEETLLATLAPQETNPAYRRYYLHNMPTQCCTTTSGTLQVTAIVKLDYRPVTCDSDTLITMTGERDRLAIRVEVGRTDGPLETSVLARTSQVNAAGNRRRVEVRAIVESES